MPAATTMAAIAVGTALLSAGTTVYATEEQKRQARLSRDQQKGALESQKRELMAREEEEGKMQKRDEEIAKKKARAAASGGRQDTILTSPLGVVGSASNSEKTLLGS